VFLRKSFLKKYMKKTIFAFFAIISLCSISVLAQSYAITNARIVTVSGAEIPSGTVVIRDGLITDVGASAKVPADAKVFDGTGLSVYPGLFDTNTNLGVPQAARPAGQQGGPGGGQGQAQTAQSNSNYPAFLQPENSIVEKLTGGDVQFETVRNNGFTTALTVSRDGIFNGQSAVINLAGDSVSAMVLRPVFAQHITYRTSGSNAYPTSLMGTFSALRQMFLDAQRLTEWRKTYAASPRGIKRPDADKSLEALIPALNREIPVVFNANSEIEIIRSLDFAREFNLRPIIAGGNESWKVADRLKKADAVVLLSLNFPRKTTASSPDADPESLETLRLRVEIPKNAARLAQAGVKFAFQSGGMQNPGDFLTNAGKAVENGLSKENALKAMTLGAAEILGVSDRLGSIEKGKIANLIVTKGDLLARDKAITHVFIDGRLFEQRPPAQRPAGPSTGTGAASNIAQVAGSWNVTIDAPGQSIAATITLQQQGSRLTGTLSSQVFGSVPIRNAEATPEGFRFEASVNVGQQIDVSFTGKVTGTQVSGTATTPQGAVPFSGTKVPQAIR
jgi:imidazolonepropionase-like amidohydrolase